MTTRTRALTVLSVGLVLALGLAGDPAIAATRYLNLHGIKPGHVLWLRAVPNPTAKKVGFIPAWGKAIRNLGCDNAGNTGWCHVRFRGTTGWAQGKFLRAGRQQLT